MSNTSIVAISIGLPVAVNNPVPASQWRTQKISEGGKSIGVAMGGQRGHASQFFRKFSYFVL